ncbi:hypothetical protein SAMN04488034_104118 [Salinimicrobium catena]|uniref:DUF2383 domain-containing protein n=1 Tax=Salinimicrobium catena TaxID=390640 RepID=A0A1H5NGN7_9FLAO|nr:hypothetical protein [Salinimicrobium catena]SDL44387.1 hypothetical protein SAMN04488140_104118 [Salinimicrobium catena]SEE99997.1 hypothetical protein SAMN04488034_104118 [Salinimicrobium catena]
MNSHNLKTKQLQLLIEDNFLVAKHCRKTMETIAEVSLRYYFQKLAAKRSQFAMELGTQLNALGGKNPYVPTSTFEKRWSDISEENKLKNVRKSLKLYKQSTRNYKRALSYINDGCCREILIRHKAHFARTVPELKALKNLIKEKQEKAKGQGSHAEIE